MKRKMKNSIAIAMSVVVSVMTLVPVAHAQPPQRFRADSGVVTPAVGQTLRVTVVGDNKADPGDTLKVRIRWMQYGAQGCSGAPPACRHMIANQGVTPVEALGPDDALSVDLLGNGAGMRIIVESNSRNARVLSIVFDTSTQRIMDTELLSLD